METEDCRVRIVEATKPKPCPVVQESLPESLTFTSILSKKAAQLEVTLEASARRQELEQIEKAQKQRLSRLRKKSAT